MLADVVRLLRLGRGAVLAVLLRCRMLLLRSDDGHLVRVRVRVGLGFGFGLGLGLGVGVGGDQP